MVGTRFFKHSKLHLDEGFNIMQRYNGMSVCGVMSPWYFDVGEYYATSSCFADSYGRPSDKYYFINIRLEKIAKHWLITNGTDWREMMSLAGVRKDLAFRVKQMIGLQKLRGEYGDLARANNRLRQECDQKLIEIFGMTGTGNK
jgi:hypothetical protein